MSERPLNPFRSTGALRDGKGFVNRTEELRILRESVLKGQAVNVYGPRRRGKTSLLFALQRELTAEHRQALYLTLESFPSETVFWKHFAAQAGMKEWNSEEPDFIALGEALASQGVVVLLDELDKAIAAPDEFTDEFFTALRGMGISQGVPFVVVSKHALASYARFHNTPSSPFSNTFLPLKLGPFAPEAAVQLLEHLKEQAEALHWPEDWMAQIHAQAEGEPWKMQRFGELVWGQALAWEDALKLWEDDIQEPAASSQLKPGVRTAAGGASQPQKSLPWYYTPGFLAFLLLLASGAGLYALGVGSLVLGVVALALFIIAAVLVYGGIMYSG